MIILLDQDGVLADFEHAFIDAWRARHPDVAPVAFENRKSFYIREDYAPELRGMAEAIYTAPGFIRDRKVASTRPRVLSLAGMWTVTKSARARPASRSLITS